MKSCRASSQPHRSSIRSPFPFASFLAWVTHFYVITVTVWDFHVPFRHSWQYSRKIKTSRHGKPSPSPFSPKSTTVFAAFFFLGHVFTGRPISVLQIYRKRGSRSSFSHSPSFQAHTFNTHGAALQLPPPNGIDPNPEKSIHISSSKNNLHLAAKNRRHQPDKTKKGEKGVHLFPSPVRQPNYRTLRSSSGPSYFPPVPPVFLRSLALQGFIFVHRHRI